MKNYATFSQRLLAFALDHMLLYLVPTLFAFWVVNAAAVTKDIWVAALWLLWFVVFVQWALLQVYFTLFFLKSGATPGKLLGGTSIEKVDGKPRTFKDGLMRHVVGYAVSSLFFHIGFWWVIKDPKRQGFHDHIAGTVVVKKNEGKGGLLTVFVVLLLLVHVFLGYSIYNSGKSKGLWSAMGEDVATFFTVVSESFEEQDEEVEDSQEELEELQRELEQLQKQGSVEI